MAPSSPNPRHARCLNFGTEDPQFHLSYSLGYIYEAVPADRTYSLTVWHLEAALLPAPTALLHAVWNSFPPRYGVIFPSVLFTLLHRPSASIFIVTIEGSARAFSLLLSLYPFLSY